jgi:hypothetical protein
LDESEQKKIIDITAALKQYYTALENIKLKEEQLAKARESTDRANRNLATASRKSSELGDKKAAAEAKRATKQG